MQGREGDLAVCFPLCLVSFYLCSCRVAPVSGKSGLSSQVPLYLSNCVHFRVPGLRLPCCCVSTAHAWLASGLSVGVEPWDPLTLLHPYRLRCRGLHGGVPLSQLTQQVGIRCQTRILWQVTELGCVSFFLSGPSSCKLARSPDLSALPPEPRLGGSSGRVFKP